MDCPSSHGSDSKTGGRRGDSLAALRLEDRVVVVAGAGQREPASLGLGNGRAAALGFAEAGASLILANRSEGSLDSTLQLLDDHGYKADHVVADITKEDDCRRIMDTALERHGRIDVVHNNVGIGLDDTPTVSMDIDAWRHIIDVNLTGAMLLSKHALRPMHDQGSGVITHVGSIAARATVPFLAYKVSKAALSEFTRALAHENARYGVRCNVLLLGLIDTPMAIEGCRRLTGERRDEIRAARTRRVPLGRMGRADEVAKAAVFLASDDASYITGAVLPVDGGLLTQVGAPLADESALDGG